MKADRKYTPTEPEAETVPSLVSGLNISEPHQKKRDGDKDSWDKRHPSHRYDLTDPELYYRIAGIASELGVPSVTPVAEQLLNFALSEYHAGRIWMDSRPNPNPKSTKMILSWQREDGLLPREIKPDRERKKRPAKIVGQKKKRPPFGFRWSQAYHDQIKALAMEYGCTVGAMVTRLLTYAVEAYRARSFKIHVTHVVKAEVAGWQT